MAIAGLFLGLPVAALEETIEFRIAGGGFGIDDRSPLQVQVSQGDRVSSLNSQAYEGIQVTKGRRGKPEIQMREAEYQADAATDLLLHFNRPPQQELGPGYRVLHQGMTTSQQIKRMGPSSGLFGADAAGLVLQAAGSTLFKPGSFWQDFSVEFWLYPVTMDEGEQVLAWDGVSMLDGQATPQSIRVEFRDRRLVWDFVNLFSRFAEGSGAKTDRLVMESKRFTLQNKRELLPRTWQHHLLRWNATSGLLQYSINGQPEAMVYTSTTGRESGDVYHPYLGERSEPRLAIGTRFTGFIDELRLSRDWVAVPQTDSFSQGGSWVIFRPVDFRDIGVGSKILRIGADMATPGTSDIAFYYKMTMLPGMAGRDDPDWVRFRPGEEIKDRNQGQYLYFKVELLADGSGGQGPGLQALTISYRPNPPPPAPGGVVALAGNGSVTLRWNAVPVNDLRGYLVYYGTRPGQYFGEGGSFQGVVKASPAEVGKTTEVTISGLENGRLYYFVVASYNQSNDPVYGIHLKRSLSKEVSARPAR